VLIILLPVRDPAIAQPSQQAIEVSFHAGQAALKRGDFALAAEDFKKVLSVDPSLLEAQVNLGLAYQGLLDYAAAARYLARALRDRPNLPGVNVIVGMDYIKLGSPEQAVPFLDRALKLDPASRDAHEAMALYQLTQKNFQGAIKQYRSIADLNSDRPEAFFEIGHQYLDLAARLAYRGARLYSDSAWGHRFLGDMLLERNRWEDATHEYQKALAIDPREVGLPTLLGDAWLHIGKLDDAEKEFRRELEMDPHYEQALLGLANIQLAKGQVSEAVASVEQVWKSSPEYLKAHPELPPIELSREAAQLCISRLDGLPEQPAKHLLLVELYSSMNENALSERESQLFQGDLSKSQTPARANSQVHPNPDSCKLHHYSSCISLEKAKLPTASSNLVLGRAYFTLQQYERATDVLAKVHGDKEANAEASYWLERAYQALGAEAYTQLANSYPDSWQAHQLRAESFALRRDRDNAVKEYEAALHLAPDNAELHESLGEFYLDNRSDTEAQAELEKAAALDPSRTKTLYLLGRLFVLDNENEKAVPFLKRALQLQPNLNEASGLLGTAYVRMGQFADAIPKLEKAAPLDHFGNIHYQLYLAYRKVGESELAKKALDRSQEIRRSSLERDQALVMGSPQAEPDQQQQ
jgi:tetratricopeptide (TPR) repeat protein